MNSLEWIDFEINFCKQKIKKLKGEILYQKSMAILLPENNSNLTFFNEFELSLNEEKLNYLQQIKSELEAWEVVKKHLEHFPSDFYNGIPEEIITMTSKIDKKDYPVIKKALEVEECKK